MNLSKAWKRSAKWYRHYYYFTYKIARRWQSKFFLAQALLANLQKELEWRDDICDICHNHYNYGHKEECLWVTVNKYTSPITSTDDL